MEHPITKDTQRVVLTRDFDYLTAGVIYRATPSFYRSGSKKGRMASVRIDRDDQSSGTFITPYQWVMLRREDGAIVTPYNAKEA